MYSPQKQFDIIESIHSWYGIGYSKKVIFKLIDLIKKGGLAFIVIGTKGDNLAFKIKEKFERLNVPFIPMLFFEDLEAKLNKLDLWGDGLVLCKEKFEIEYPPLVEFGKLTQTGIILAQFYSMGKIDLNDTILQNELVTFYQEIKTPVHISGVIEIWKI